MIMSRIEQDAFERGKMEERKSNIKSFATVIMKNFPDISREEALQLAQEVIEDNNPSE